jgi:hypothetical protein
MSLRYIGLLFLAVRVLGRAERTPIQDSLRFRPSVLDPNLVLFRLVRSRSR